MSYAFYAQTKRAPDAFGTNCFPGVNCKVQPHLFGNPVDRLERRGWKDVLTASNSYANNAWALCRRYELKQFQPRFDAVIAHAVNNPPHLDSGCVGAFLQAFKELLVGYTFHHILFGGNGDFGVH